MRGIPDTDTTIMYGYTDDRTHRYLDTQITRYRHTNIQSHIDTKI